MNHLCGDNITDIASYLSVKDLLSFLTTNKNTEYCGITIPGYNVTIDKENIVTFRKSILKILSSIKMNSIFKSECTPSGMIHHNKKKYTFYDYETIKIDLEESDELQWSISDRKEFLTDYIDSLGILLLTTSNICCNEIINLNPVKQWYESRCCVSINLNNTIIPAIKVQKIHRVYRHKMIGECKNIIKKSLLLKALIY